LIRLAIRCRRADAEVALAELLELAPGGVEEVERPGGHDGMVEYAIYGAPGELPDLGTVQAAVGGALVEVRSERVPSDWEQRWKRFFHPVLIGGRLYVRPPWERAAERGGVVEVVIDPGRAFGTGTHPTTGMCLELLLAEAGPGGLLRRLRRRRARSFCDLGCGSGVLAIAAAKLGFAPVVAVDSEQAAIDECSRNARLNYVDVECRRVDLREEPPIAADVVTANLTTNMLEQLAVHWAAGATRPGVMIASGFQAGEAERVRHAFASVGLSAERLLTSGEWGGLRARRACQPRTPTASGGRG
jgi:ribosomal protein L11 methyltransferase